MMGRQLLKVVKRSHPKLAERTVEKIAVLEW